MSNVVITLSVLKQQSLVLFWEKQCSGAAGLLQLEKLHLGWCSSISDDDMKGLQALTRLSDLQLSRTKVCLCLP